jgi:DNA segregation ATPase FtsK/SpoIIIE-like protein
VVESEAEYGEPRPRSRAWLLAPLLAILIPVAIGLAWAQRDDDDAAARRSPPPARVLAVEPVPHAANAEAQARELSTWLRTHTR